MKVPKILKVVTSRFYYLKRGTKGRKKKEKRKKKGKKEEKILLNYSASCSCNYYRLYLLLLTST